MMQGWETVTLESVCTKVTDGTHDTPEVIESGFPLIKGKDISKGFIDFENCDHVSEAEHLAIIKRSHPEKGDILFSNIGSVGDCVFINTDKAFSIKNVALFKPDPKKVLPRFLYYVVSGEKFTGEILAKKSGSAQPFISLGALRSQKISIPALPIQQKIAAILAAYDDLIENNLKRIKLLEEMAQITYEEWFVHRRINGNLITDENIRYVEMKELISDYKNGGWGKEEPEGKFTEEGYVIRGTDIPDILSGSFNSVPKRFHTQSNLEPRALVTGDIIMEMSNGNMGNVGRSLYYDDSFNAILGSKVMCASFCKMARAKNIGYSYLVDAHIKYIHKNNQMLVYKSQGANGINNFQFEQMIEEEIINIPENKKALDELISYFDGVYKNLSVLRKQIHFLKEARDILLPRLMTGVIDVESYDPAQLLKEAA